MKDLIRDIINSVDDIRNSRKRKGFLKEKLLRVRISSHRAVYNDFIINQTAQRSGIIGNTIFYNGIKPDFDFVINKPNKALNYNKEKSFLLHIEPPSYIKKLGLSSPKIVNKFRKVYTSDLNLVKRDNEKYFISPPFVHWHLGVNYHINKIRNDYIIDYDFLLNGKYPDKEINMSVINSNLMIVEGHKIRARFLEKLCENYSNFNLYGGSKWANFKQYIDNAPNGKWYPFSKSRYVLVIENEKAPYYWSEKFSDVILSFATPIYYGCPNISDYFPEGSYYAFDIKKKDSIEELISVVESDFHEKNIGKLIEARNLILKKYNMFSFMNKVINDNL